MITGPGGQRLSASANGLSRSGALVALRADEFGATYIGVDAASGSRSTKTART
jgi:hypothetical protein